MTDDSKKGLTVGRPSRTGERAENPALRKAVASMKKGGEEKPVRAVLPIAYSHKLGTLNAVCKGQPSDKELIAEALELLFEQYAQGHGRHEVVGSINVADLFEEFDQQ